MDQYQDVIEQLKKQNPQALIVFGSHAWGTPHKDSDLDILMVKDTDKSPTERITDVHYQLKSHYPVDVLVLTPREAEMFPKKYSFYRQVINEGKIVYGRI